MHMFAMDLNFDTKNRTQRNSSWLKICHWRIQIRINPADEFDRVLQQYTMNNDHRLKYLTMCLVSLLNLDSRTIESYQTVTAERLCMSVALIAVCSWTDTFRERYVRLRIPFYRYLCQLIGLLQLDTDAFTKKLSLPRWQWYNGNPVSYP